MNADRIYTVGHSSRQSTELMALLNANGIQALVDVRAHPYSRRFPQFNMPSLRQLLEAAGIQYHWAGRQLGGLRTVDPGSPHTALRDGLRGYADFMEDQHFERAIDQLMHIGARSRTAVMCAERDPEQCHRSLIADLLVTLRHVEVIHIVTLDQVYPHRLRAEVNQEQLARGRLVYDRNTHGSLDLGEV